MASRSNRSLVKAVMQASLQLCRLGWRGTSRRAWVLFAPLEPEVTSRWRVEDVYIEESYYVRWRGCILCPLLSLWVCSPPSSPLGREFIGRSCSCEAQQRHRPFSARRFSTSSPSYAERARVLGRPLLFFPPLNLWLRVWQELWESFAAVPQKILFLSNPKSVRQSVVLHTCISSDKWSVYRVVLFFNSVSMSVFPWGCAEEQTSRFLLSVYFHHDELW